MKMKLIKHAFLLITSALLAGALAGCPGSKKGEGSHPEADSSHPALTKVKVRLAWLQQASYVPFDVAKEKGFYEKRGLDVEIVPSGPDLRPIAPVAAGEDQFGIEGASAIIQAAANGVPIVVIGDYLRKSPEVFMARKSDHLTDIQSWKGKKIGLWIGTHLEPTLYAMLGKVGMSKNDVAIVPAKFDIVPFLAEGESRVPIWNAYVYNEAQLPQEKGIEVDLITPESVGIKQVGEGLFTSKQFLAKNPEIVRAFVIATIEGIKYAAEHQEEAIQILTSGKYGTGFDVPHQTRMLKAAAPLWLGDDNRPLSVDSELWKETVKTSFTPGDEKPVDIHSLVHPEIVKSVMDAGEK